jgi:phenylacetate-coenzyme A ligase PaaK-like adenylate-forming protein
MSSLQPTRLVEKREAGAGALYAWAYDHLLFSVWQRAVRGRPIREHLGLLEKTQWAVADELERMQLASLRALLEHAGRHVPYWRELFARLRFDPRDVRRLTDIRALPVLTRETVQDRFDDLRDPTRRRATIRKGTSGTTGVPLRFEYCNESEAWRQATRLRGYGWAGYRLGLPTLHYWGAGAVVPHGLRAKKIRFDRWARREVYVDAVKQDEASLRRTVDVLRRIRPHAIVAYTQALAAFARWVSERGVRDWPDVNVICAAEALLPGDRDAIELAFGPRVFDTYGSRETMLIAAECGAHSGMHMSEENVLVEIVQGDLPAAAGVPGDVLVTDLHNYAMPFIRYANGDVATLSTGGPCPCGRGLRRLASVEGRRVDTLRDANGEPVSGMLFISLMQTDTQVLRAFQVVQHKAGDVELHVVRGSEWDAVRFDATIRRARGYLKGLPVRVTFCDEIPPSKSGKRRPIVVETE